MCNNFVKVCLEDNVILSKVCVKNSPKEQNKRLRKGAKVGVPRNVGVRRQVHIAKNLLDKYEPRNEDNLDKGQREGSRSRQTIEKEKIPQKKQCFICDGDISLNCNLNSSEESSEKSVFVSRF